MAYMKLHYCPTCGRKLICWETGCRVPDGEPSQCQTHDLKCLHPNYRRDPEQSQVDYNFELLTRFRQHLERNTPDALFRVWESFSDSERLELEPVVLWAITKALGEDETALESAGEKFVECSGGCRRMVPNDAPTHATPICCHPCNVSGPENHTEDCNLAMVDFHK